MTWRQRLALLAEMSLRLPILRVGGRRYRATCRWMIGWRGLHRRIDRDPEGTVVRLWIGWLLVTVLIDDRVHEPWRRLTPRQAEWQIMQAIARARREPRDVA